ncbi:MAG: type II toxin-antitoxin system RelE/ParE family toxin [Bacteroidales bacterium]|nr:type II toxin-antitoxin system RelE/ParE family toxin [Bacteroidales bacterium]
MAKWHFTRKAVADLDSIWNYTAEKWSESQADSYYGGLIAEVEQIVDSKCITDREYSEIKK